MKKVIFSIFAISTLFITSCADQMESEEIKPSFVIEQDKENGGAGGDHHNEDPFG